MKRFYIRSLLFVLPVVLFVAVPSWVLFSTGENLRGVDGVIQRSDRFLMGYAYNQENYNYVKWKTLVSREKYGVVALGSSRVLEFRSRMFDSSFYNAGYTISALNEFVPFFQHIPREKYPDYLIISLDQWTFNANWDSLTTPPDSKKWAESFHTIPDQSTLINVWKDLLHRKYSLFLPRKRDNIPCIGLNAIVEGTGFRSDGSALYGKQVRKLLAGDTTAADYNYQETFGYIGQGTMRFNYGDRINEKALPELEKLMQFCKTNGIKLVAFLPPYADKVNEQMQATGRYTYIQAIYPAISPVFAQYGFEVYDFSSLGSVGSNDAETLDGFHGGELTYLKILIKMLESNSVLNNVTSVERLRNDLKHPLNRYAVYEE